MPEDAEKIRASYFRAARRDSIATFSIVTVLAGGGAVILLKLFWAFPFDSLVAFGIGSLFGAAAAAWLFAVGFRDYSQVRADLSSGECEVLEVNSCRAISVSLGGEMPAIALDCGAHTLVLAGNWWTDQTRKGVWRSSRERRSFPASRFILRRLPRSGRVLDVEVSASKLQIEENDPIEPLLKVDFPAFMESYYVKKRIDDLLIARKVMQR